MHHFLRCECANGRTQHTEHASACDLPLRAQPRASAGANFVSSGPVFYVRTQPPRDHEHRDPHRVHTHVPRVSRRQLESEYSVRAACVGNECKLTAAHMQQRTSNIVTSALSPPIVCSFSSFSLRASQSMLRAQIAQQHAQSKPSSKLACVAAHLMAVSSYIS